MPSVELRVDTGGSDWIPHSFIVVTGPDGVERGYGLAPREHGTLTGDGKIYDDTNHEYNATTGKLDLSDAEYSRLMDFINRSEQNPPPYYLPFGSQCANWAVKALVEAGIPAIASPNLLPDNFIRDLFETIVWNPYTQWLNITISNAIGTTPDPLVKTIRYVDPMILDLDGDGLEITPLSKGILFDANGDTIKTGTAWAGADDGMLVWDRDGNGLIDSGRELFGDETILANGQKAAHGFAALGDLDKGSVVNGVTVGASDGVFDSKDTQYANLRIWRDLNQDGVSQANELKTLAETGVTSIKLGSSTINTNYGDAILAQSSTFTRADGSSGQAGSFILAQNNFVRQFTPITVSDAAKALPGLKGSGWVRDLQEAATLSPELITLFNQAKDAATRAGYKNAVAGLMREWGNDSGYSSASKQALSAGYGLILSDPADAQEAGWMDKAIKASEVDRNAYRATLSAADLTKFDAMRERMVGGLEKIHAYEAFTGHTFLNWSQVQGDAINYTPMTSAGSGLAITQLPLARAGGRVSPTCVIARPDPAAPT